VTRPGRLPSDGRYDWDGLAEQLAALSKAPEVADARVQIAAENAVIYRDIVTAMDLAVTSGFRNIAVIDPGSLTVALTR